jgi:hypothetical protein
MVDIKGNHPLEVNILVKGQFRGLFLDIPIFESLISIVIPADLHLIELEMVDGRLGSLGPGLWLAALDGRDCDGQEVFFCVVG